MPVFVSRQLDDHNILSDQQENQEDYVFRPEQYWVRGFRCHNPASRQHKLYRPGLTHSALSQMELSGRVKRTGTLEKLAIAMNLNVKQFTD